MTRKYKGFYKYDNEKMQKICAHPKTNFSIEIIKTDVENFYGIIKDDLNTGGTPGNGTITGKLIGDKISFIKQMPIACLQMANSQRIYLNKKHPKIHYEGTKFQNKFKGTWKIKFGIIFNGLLPMLGATTTGTWEMEED